VVIIAVRRAAKDWNQLKSRRLYAEWQENDMIRDVSIS
jgi:hypothetical protein